MTLEYEYQGPKRGADRAVLLAHGAGADMHAKALTVVADALADAKIPSLRFQYPYRAAGKKAPDRPPVLNAATRLAATELGISNALIEGINAKIRLINARGYGHHSAQTLSSMIYLCLGGLQVKLPTTT